MQCVCLCVQLCIDDCTHTSGGDQRAVLWGRKGSDSKIECQLSAVASLSVSSHVKPNQLQCCLSCPAQSPLQF